MTEAYYVLSGFTPEENLTRFHNLDTDKTRAKTWLARRIVEIVGRRRLDASSAAQIAHADFRVMQKILDGESVIAANADEMAHWLARLGLF